MTGPERSALALMGVPGLCGFVSKWHLAKAAVECGEPLAYAGVAALLLSALLTAIYMICITAPAQRKEHIFMKEWNTRWARAPVIPRGVIRVTPKRI